MSDRAIRQAAALAAPLDGDADLDPLLERVRGCGTVLIGEASHGTSEFYRWRARLTRRLIEEADASFVAVEGDWPDCYAVNCWLTGREPGHRSATDVLDGFQRWPTWMWANAEVADFLEWLRSYNDRSGRDVGFYGLDVYSLWESIERIVGYVREQRPDALESTLAALDCFEPYGGDPHRYAHATRLVPDGCEAEVVEMLTDLRRLTRADLDADERDFDALQNTEVVAGAERYYRTMMRGDAASWNIRDEHMADTLDRIVEHRGPDVKGVVWAHNTHVGDARATDMAGAGMTNLGQIVRERRGAGAALIGFGGYAGTVIAAPRWGAPLEAMEVPPARSDSVEELLHRAVGRPACLVFPEDRSGPLLTDRRGHRAIGVVYQPRRDPVGNWVPTVLGARYDAFISFETTEALHPLAAAPDRAESDERATEPWSA